MAVGMPARHERQALGSTGRSTSAMLRRPSRASARPGPRCRSNIVWSRGRRRSASMRQTRWSTAASATARCAATNDLPSLGAALVTTSTLPGLLGVAEAIITLARSRRNASLASGVSAAGRIGFLGRRQRDQRQHRQAEPVLDVGGEWTWRRRYSRPKAPPSRADHRQQDGGRQPLDSGSDGSAPRAGRPGRRPGSVPLSRLVDSDGFLGLLQQRVEDLAGADRLALERGVLDALAVERAPRPSARSTRRSGCFPARPPTCSRLRSRRPPWRSRPAAAPAPIRARRRPAPDRDAWVRAARPAGRPAGQIGGLGPQPLDEGVGGDQRMRLERRQVRSGSPRSAGTAFPSCSRSVLALVTAALRSSIFWPTMFCRSSSPRASWLRAVVLQRCARSPTWARCSASRLLRTRPTGWPPRTSIRARAR